MICENCGKREATVHLTEIIKNRKSEYHLCDLCAKDIRLKLRVQNCSDSLQDMLEFLDNDRQIAAGNDDCCMNCGLTGLEFKKTLKTGCPFCYLYFKDTMDSLISHLKTSERHRGKIPENYIALKEYKEEQLINAPCETEADLENNADLLKAKLEIAVSEERYEDAAILRDMVKELERVG